MVNLVTLTRTFALPPISASRCSRLCIAIYEECASGADNSRLYDCEKELGQCHRACFNAKGFSPKIIVEAKGEEINPVADTIDVVYSKKVDDINNTYKDPIEDIDETNVDHIEDIEDTSEDTVKSSDLVCLKNCEERQRTCFFALNGKFLCTTTLKRCTNTC